MTHTDAKRRLAREHGRAGAPAAGGLLSAYRARHAAAGTIASPRYPEGLVRMRHDLRAPLNAIDGFAALIEGAASQLDAEKVRAYARHILVASDTLLHRSDALMDIAEIDAVGLAPRPAQTDAASLLAGAIRRTARAAAGAGVALEDRTAPGPGDRLAVRCDPDLLARGLEYALRDAIGRSARGGRVLARVDFAAAAAVDAAADANDRDASPGRGDVEIALRDFGEAVDKSAYAAAFESLSTHEAPDRICAPGADLALARLFVETAGGAFSVKSKTGTGALIRLVLPAAEA